MPVATRVKEQRSPRLELQQKIEATRQDAARIAGEREETQERYRAAVRRGDTLEAAEMKRRLKELSDESEISGDRLQALESRWPDVERAEARERLPEMFREYLAGIEELQRESQEAVEGFHQALDGLDGCREREKDLIALRSEIHRVSEQAGAARPDLPTVPERFDRSEVINSLGRVQAACAYD